MKNVSPPRWDFFHGFGIMTLMKPHYFRLRFFKYRGKIERGRIYLFCGLASPRVLYLPAIVRFRNHGFSVVCFNFRTKAIMELNATNLSTPLQEVFDAVKAVEQDQTSEVPVYVIGNSMGSVFAIHTASHFSFVKKLVINTGYASISEHIFNDKAGAHWRNKLIAEGHDERSFQRAIIDIEPLSVFHKLKGKTVMLFLNKDDNVISFNNSIRYKEALEKENIPYDYIENSDIRHGTAIMKNLLSRRLMGFLRI